MKFNINNKVRVRLTPRGREILGREKYLRTEDEFGWSTWQLWVLMSTFGEHVGLGFDPPFETEIELAEK